MIYGYENRKCGNVRHCDVKALMFSMAGSVTGEEVFLTSGLLLLDRLLDDELRLYEGANTETMLADVDVDVVVAELEPVVLCCRPAPLVVEPLVKFCIVLSMDEGDMDGPSLLNCSKLLVVLLLLKSFELLLRSERFVPLLMNLAR